MNLDRRCVFALLASALLACGDAGGQGGGSPAPDAPDAIDGASGSGVGVVQSVAKSAPLPAPGEPAARAPSYVVGGSVEGLLGGGLVLESSMGETLAIDRDGRFSFGTRVSAGLPFAVRVRVQPSAPPQRCGVSAGGGGVVHADVTNLRVVCQRPEVGLFPIGASVRGLVGRGLVVQNRGGDDVAVLANGALTFPTALPGGASYDVSISQQPRDPSQTCAVANGRGEVGDAPVTSPVITCTTNAYALGGFVSGLQGSLGLSLADGTFAQISAAGPFTFPRALPSGSSYFVSITSAPGHQRCRLEGERGAIVDADVRSVVVSCDQSWHALAATVSGLTESGLLLEDDLGEVISVGADGSYPFTARRPSGMPYAIHVKRQPWSLQHCTVEGGAGVIGHEDAVASVTCGVPPVVDLFVAQYATGTIDVFRSDDDGDLPPRRQIGGPSTQLELIRSLVVSGGEIFAGGASASILVFDKAAAGDVPPLRAITGPSTLLYGVSGLDVAGGELYVAASSSVVVFDKGANGDATPLRVLEGHGTLINDATAVRVIGEELFVSDAGTYSVHVYPRAAAGDVAPIRTLPVPMPPSSVLPVGHDEIFVASLVGFDSLLGVVIDTRTGALLRTIRTPFDANTHIHSECAYRAGTIACASAVFPPSVLFFPSSADGELPQVRRIEGPSTTFPYVGPTGIAYDR